MQILPAEMQARNAGVRGHPPSLSLPGAAMASLHPWKALTTPNNLLNGSTFDLYHLSPEIGSEKTRERSTWHFWVLETGDLQQS